jgi:hypothetical protein
MVRVEIHKADRETYDWLHAAMAAESISRVVTGARDGKKYHMPIGTYWAETTGDAWTVLEAAKRAALPIDPRAEIAVSGVGQIVFFNCPEVVPERPLAAMLRVGLAASAPRVPAPNLMAPPIGTPYSRLTSLKSLVPATPTPASDYLSAVSLLPYIRS